MTSAMPAKCALAAIALALSLALALPASAHRLDEYLQATTIAVAADKVEVHLRLTPGAEVVPAVIAGIDRDGDGALSQAEWAHYAVALQADLSLQADGSTLALRPAQQGSFPGRDFAEVDMAQLRAGEAAILLDFEADLPSANGLRMLSFENRHHSDMAVYLVNALAPRDPAVRILGQRRSPDQSSWRLDFIVEQTGH